MAFKVVWSHRALKDVKAIASYIGNDSSAYASTVIRNIVTRTKTLARFPRSGGMVPEFDDENLRELMAYNYRIIYQLQSEQVLIVPVIHGKQILH